MAAIEGVLQEPLRQSILDSKVLVVGAGGIGCEILKNLVLSGFLDIEIIDLDTIDVSNLNRQFLFQKEHVGKSKAIVARESAMQYNTKVNIIAHHASVMNQEYSVNYFKKFNLVMNALDNRAARNHVNRMCLAADVPLLESGTAGYDGQVELIRKGLTQCYECMPKAPQKTFPGCTIRNTPSEPIHCIVWAKHLFNQLFGEEDPDQDVSPDTADPEAAGDTAGEEALQKEANEQGNVDRVSTRTWAQSTNYNPEKIFNKLFHDDIKYLLSMDNLWKKRKPPVPLEWSTLPELLTELNKEENQAGLKDQKHWSIAKCGEVFADSIGKLSKAFEECRKKAADDHLVWDKDDEAAMDFVAACANIRAYIFGIAQKTRFDIKSMAGNIIPAIATTNAIIAGIVVLYAFRVLQSKFDECKSVYLRPKMNHRNQLIVPEKRLNPPNPNCYVCAPTNCCAMAVDTKTMSVLEFQEYVLQKGLNMIEPDVIIDGKGIVVISSEPGETEENNKKTLEEVGIVDGTILAIDDFQQNYSLKATIVHREKPPAHMKLPDWIIEHAAKDFTPQDLMTNEERADKEKKAEETPSTSNGNSHLKSVSSESPEPSGPGSAKKRKIEDSTVDDTPTKKLKIEDSTIDTPTKRLQIDSNSPMSADSDDDCCIIMDDDEEQPSSASGEPVASTSKHRPTEDDDDDCFIVEDDDDDSDDVNMIGEVINN
ncbi:SUMO-activating enzyme subunit 2 [Trichogramma pretiosum]|uniref:SUMO-activating enzyme subunit 2 n=1 Tax=Trichogramma pretiosum TaxID=7493 RepID=UPI0006C9AA6A|nr:SUMO-activating enzyme subunit 2 [Trichogramma pretiosum]